MAGQSPEVLPPVEASVAGPGARRWIFPCDARRSPNAWARQQSQMELGRDMREGNKQLQDDARP